MCRRKQVRSLPLLRHLLSQTFHSSHRDCNTCSFNKCVALSSSKAKGVSAGAVAGAVIASVIFLVLGVLAFLWFRRRQRALAAASGGEVKRDVPARAEDVLGRPDPNEKPPTPVQETHPHFQVYAAQSATTINLDPRSQESSAVGTPGHGSGMRDLHHLSCHQYWEAFVIYQWLLTVMPISHS